MSSKKGRKTTSPIKLFSKCEFRKKKKKNLQQLMKHCDKGTLTECSVVKAEWAYKFSSCWAECLGPGEGGRNEKHEALWMDKAQ